MIDVENLSKHFDAFKAVDNINFSVKTGEVLGFLGPNGAGKSTTMKLITGFMRPTSGRAIVLGTDVQKRPQVVQRQLGYLPEGAPAYSDMRVAEFLAFIANVRGYSGKERTRRVAAVVERLTLNNVMNQPIHTLSKGFNRRVGIAQALIHDPAVLIMDEPTDGLDPNQKHEVRELLRGLSTDKTVIISTHILEEVEAVCHRALIIAAGQVKADNTPAELLKQSAYCGAVTLELDAVEPIRLKLKNLPGVQQIEPSLDNPNRVTLLPKPGEKIYPALQQALRDANVEPESMSIERGRLDDVFRRITQENTAPEVSL